MMMLLKRYVVIGILLIFSFVLNATSYYLSEYGADNNSGLSDSEAWKTLKQVQFKIEDGTLKIGDSVLFKRNSSFTAYKIDVSVGLHFDAYGKGASPIISGLREITGFEKRNETLYFKNVGSSYVEWLVFNGKPREKGAWPNEPTLLLDKVDLSDIENSRLQDSDLKGKDFTGGEVVVNLNFWSNGVYKIKKHYDDVITVDVFTSYKPNATQWGSYYNIQNHPDVFEETGDWAYIDDTLWMHSDVPFTNHKVQISYCDTLFSVVARDEISFRNLKIVGIDNVVINAQMNGNLVLENLDIKTIGSFCMGNVKKSKFISRGVNIEDNFGRSYTIWGKPDTMIITEATCKRLGLIRGYDRLNVGGYNGNFCMSGYNDYQELSFLRIDSVGYNIVSSGNNIHHNVLSNTNLILKDGAAIHIGHDGNDTVHIYNNIIVRGNRGIYQDYGGQNYQIYNNLVTDCSYSGYYCNDAKRTDIYRNTFYNNSANIKIQQWADSTTLGYVNDLKIYDNISYTSKEWRYHLVYGLGNISVPACHWNNVGFGQLDHNYIIAWEDNKIARIYGGSGIRHNEYFRFSDLKLNGYEKNATLFIESNPKLIYNAGTIDSIVDLPAPMMDVFGTVYETNIILKPFSWKVLLPLMEVQQKYFFTAGWNNVAINIQPIHSSPEHVFESLIEQGMLNKIQTEEGKTFEPGYDKTWINEIGGINHGSTLRVHVNQSCSVLISGYEYHKENTLTLKKGWNMFPYLGSESRDGLDVLSTDQVLHYVVRVQDKDGNSIYKQNDGLWVNKIGDFKPNKAYHIKVTEACDIDCK